MCLDNFSGSIFICWPQHLPEHKNQHLTDDKHHASWVETVLCKLYYPYSHGLGLHGKKSESLPCFPLEAQAQVSARVRNQAWDNKRRRGHPLPSVHRDHAVFSPEAQPLRDPYHCSASQMPQQRDKTQRLNSGQEERTPNTRGREIHTKTPVSTVPPRATTEDMQAPSPPTQSHLHISAQGKELNDSVVLL